MNSFVCRPHIFVSVAALLISVVAGSRNYNFRRSCPYPTWLKEDVLHCLQAYEDIYAQHSLSDMRLYTGVDPEVVRTMCSYLKSALDCVNEMKNVCPQSLHDQIDHVMKPYYPSLELCFEEHLHEKYAMNQNCFLAQRPSSVSCYEKFIERSASNKIQVYKGNRVAILHYCRMLTELTICVRDVVQSPCGRTAADLSELLVRSSIDLSYKCKSELHEPEKKPSVDHSPYIEAAQVYQLEPNDSAPLAMSSLSAKLLLIVISLTSFAFYSYRIIL